MYEGSPVSLQMVKNISADAIIDNTMYGCHISTKKEVLYCTGVVKERFQSEEGNMLVFRIEDGFYSASESGGAR